MSDNDLDNRMTTSVFAILQVELRRGIMNKVMRIPEWKGIF